MIPQEFVIMEESDKLPLKRVELSLTKFNEVAIPHHLDLLRQHKANIIKQWSGGAGRAAAAEQSGARRAAARLRALLAELSALRRRVRAADLRAFDARTQRSRDLTLAAIRDYLDTSPMEARKPSLEPPAAGSAASTDSVGLLPPPEEAPPLQLQVDEQELALREREAVLRGWSELQAEVRALHDAWQHVHAAALEQRELVGGAADGAAAAADNVAAARAHLSAADRLRAAAWVAGGALGGALAGGPVGLAVGAKAGAAAALAGSVLGALGVRLLGRRRPEPAPEPEPEPEPRDKAD